MTSAAFRRSSFLAGVLAVAALSPVAAARQGTITPTRLRTLTAEQEQILSYLSFEMVPDGAGNMMPTIRVTGANLQIVNGLGATNGYPPNPDSTSSALTVTNGLGNLIVGYNELGNPYGDNRSG